MPKIITAYNKMHDSETHDTLRSKKSESGVRSQSTESGVRSRIIPNSRLCLVCCLLCCECMFLVQVDKKRAPNSKF